MANKKKQVATEETVDVAALVAQLYEVTSIWKSAHVLSGHALEFVKTKVEALNEALNSTVTEEEEETASGK